MQTNGPAAEARGAVTAGTLEDALGGVNTGWGRPRARPHRTRFLMRLQVEGWMAMASQPTP
jgi:hypothetical protein